MAIYRVKIGDTEFKCNEREDIEDLYDVLFSYSINRRKLYELIVEGNASVILSIDGNNNMTKFNEYTIGLKVLQQIYGEKYDPDSELISINDPMLELESLGTAKE